MKIKLTVKESRCRCGLMKEGDVFIVEDVCPPICHELWYSAYPYFFALLNGSDLDFGETRRKAFEARCPDGGRVVITGEILEESGVSDE